MTPAELHALPHGTPIIVQWWNGPKPGKIRRDWQFGTAVRMDDRELPDVHILAGGTSEEQQAAKVELAPVTV